MGRTLNVPAVIIAENNDDFKVSLAVPGTACLLSVVRKKKTKKKMAPGSTARSTIILLSAAALLYPKM